MLNHDFNRPCLEHDSLLTAVLFSCASTPGDKPAVASESPAETPAAAEEIAPAVPSTPASTNETGRMPSRELLRLGEMMSH